MEHPDQRLALIEVIERDGRPGRAVSVGAWPLTLGRAIDNHMVLDDPHVAAHHLRVEPGQDGELELVVLPSRNGVQADGQRLQGGQRWPLPQAGATLVVGTTRLRLRLPGELLAPERPLPGPVAGRVSRPLAAGLALLAVVSAGHWVGLDPGADVSAWLPVLVGIPGAVVAWCAMWALLSKLFQHRFDFGAHLRIVLHWLLLMSAADLLLPQLAAALAQRWLWQLAPPLQGVLGALLLHAHLAHVLPQHRRMVGVGVAAMVLVGGAISLALTYRNTDSFSNLPYMSTLPLPALRLGGTVPASTLVQELAPLSERLAQRVKKARADEPDDAAEGAE